MSKLRDIDEANACLAVIVGEDDEEGGVCKSPDDEEEEEKRRVMNMIPLWARHRHHLLTNDAHQEALEPKNVQIKKNVHEQEEKEDDDISSSCLTEVCQSLRSDLFAELMEYIGKTAGQTMTADDV